MKLAQGAEAIITRKGDVVEKKRISKGYRINEIDADLRKRRTRIEARNLAKISKLVPCPKVIDIDEETATITMQFIEGDKLSDCLENEHYVTICKKLGEDVAKLHDNNIIHGDLTTSNFILNPNKKVYFLDLGLSFHSTKDEDKAVDLHVLKEALESRHFTIFEDCFKAFSEGYKNNEVLERLKKVELRGRNKNKG
jgi:Kae1-associated kinase Bud32